MKIDITAHRGSSDAAPENTMSAINLAIQEQADYAEIDVQQTKDGSLVLLHDSNLKRVTGIERNIWELSDNEVDKLDVGNWFSLKFAGEKVPYLEEVIDAVKGKIKLNIELKLNGHEQNLAEHVAELICQKEFTEQCLITSFDYHTLVQVKKINAQVATGLIFARPIENLANFKVDFYSVEQMVATIDFINTAHAIGRNVHVWTVNKIAEMGKFISRGVDNIITNRPKTLHVLLEKQLAR
ncbi:MAG: glycerophosphodiester phosphodiesterase [Symploca sp. SIO2E9]|nr:glycerophosphodiester phosphodiesterase [Symploca sp. SIO2E9]